MLDIYIERGGLRGTAFGNVAFEHLLYARCGGLKGTSLVIDDKTVMFRHKGQVVPNPEQLWMVAL